LYLDKLKAINFRNYKHLELKLSPDLNIIYGDNAQGKTNLIEVVSLLTMGRSFRTKRDEEMIKKGETGFYTKGIFKGQTEEVSIEIGKNRQENLVKLNGNQIKRRKDVFGKIKIVIFSPEDLQLIKGGPGYRREYLDIYIGQVFPGYRGAFQKYYKALYQRNALLKKIKKREKTDSSLEVWNEELIEEGSKVLYYRIKAINEIRAWIREYHYKISGEKEEIECFYEGPCHIEQKFGKKVEEIKSELEMQLRKKRQDEYRRGITLVGPHRDDISIILNKELDIRFFGSQGQQRTAALSLKMAMLDFIKQVTDETPILLLDDVFSEFDNERKKELLEMLIKRTQTFITTANIKALNNKNLGTMTFKVEGGKINKTDGLFT